MSAFTTAALQMAAELVDREQAGQQQIWPLQRIAPYPIDNRNFCTDYPGTFLELPSDQQPNADNQSHLRTRLQVPTLQQNAHPQFHHYSPPIPL
ncbi:hypothetical protein AA0111_g422 [Alternaria arborescens]|uniref:hypothetical protein n=1 Tax=Alternaria arborescens TaxID=156630 RepID=UPI001074BE76|nr:hypothetical protein AA0111_g422 [Alternaria arborescens]RYO43318.1 hypothetical protein AA0111_g422 [Alternaria arborescens]